MAISKVHRIDATEYMRACPYDKAFDLGVPDPPYALGQDLKKVLSRANLAKTPINNEFTWDNAIPEPEYFSELFRVTKNQIIWGANYFPEVCGEVFKSPRRKDYAEFILQHPTGWIIWDKCNGENDFNDCELAWTSFPVKTEIFYFMWAGMRQGLSMKEGRTMQGNKRLNEKRIHPTQKPLALYQWTYTKFAKPGDVILDTHMGSQNSRIVAHEMGFHYFGCEINERHFTDGCKRYKNYISRPLFERA